MRSVNLMLEETKHASVTKEFPKIETRKSNSSYLVGETPFIPAIQTCLDNPPHLIYQIAHETISTGGTNFQSYLVGELLPKSKVKYTMKRVSIIPANSNAMKEIKNTLEANKEMNTAQLIESYKSHINEFKVIRFALIQNIFKKDANRSTSLSSETSGSDKQTQVPSLIEPNAVTTIKELVCYASEYCIAFTKEIEKDFEEKAVDQQVNKDLLLRYVTFWNKFFLSALEINNHLSALNDVMNKATEATISKLEKKVPNFSLWRILVGVFRTYTYLPLHACLHKHYLTYVKNYVLKHLKSKVELPKPAITATFDIAAFMKAEEEMEMNNDEEQNFSKTSDDLQTSRVVFQSLLDMSLNEITVHYLNSKELLLKVCQDFTNPLIEELNEIAEAAIKFFGKTSKFIEIFSGELVLLQKIFPPCMWDDIEMAGRKITLGIIKEKLSCLAQEFAKLSKQEKKEKASGCQPHTDDRLLIPIMQTLKNELGKPCLVGEEVKLFVPYVHQEHATLYKECVEQRTAYSMAQSKEKRVEDIEIAIRNKCLDLLIDEDANVLFKMGGMNISEVQKIPF